MTERRRFARIPLSMLLKFKTLEKLGDALDASACDLSENGVCIRTEIFKPVGTRVEIELPVPGGAPVTVKGTIRSIINEGGKPARMGIEFDELTDPALGIIQYLVNKNRSK